MKCKYCGEKKDVYNEKYSLYCYKCGKYTYKLIGKIKSIGWRVSWYFKILFCFWSPAFKEWWSYFLEEKRDKEISWPRILWCRWRGHPYGVIWFSNGPEPDMTCKNCGDEVW